MLQRTQMFEIEKTKYKLGAYVSNCDLSKPLSEKDFKVLYQALSKYEVLFFREQNISHEDHRRLASLFGDMQTHPAYPTVEGLSLIHI